MSITVDIFPLNFHFRFTLDMHDLMEKILKILTYIKVAQNSYQDTRIHLREEKRWMRNLMLDSYIHLRINFLIS